MASCFPNAVLQHSSKGDSGPFLTWAPPGVCTGREVLHVWGDATCIGSRSLHVKEACEMDPRVQKENTEKAQEISR